MSPETADALTGIPWRNIIGMRNRIVHDYFDVDLDIVGAVPSVELDPLIAALERYLEA